MEDGKLYVLIRTFSLQASRQIVAWPCNDRAEYVEGTCSSSDVLETHDEDPFAPMDMGRPGGRQSQANSNGSVQSNIVFLGEDELDLWLMWWWCILLVWIWLT